MAVGAGSPSDDASTGLTAGGGAEVAATVSQLRDLERTLLTTLRADVSTQLSKHFDALMAVLKPRA